jgi:hypothetical protein
MPCPSLTLTAVESKLNNLTLHEDIDVSVLDKLINSDLLKDSFHNPTASLLYSSEREQLQAYKKLIKLGKAEVKYVRTTGMSFGRCNPVKALGLFCIRREIRHTLAKTKYTDIDIENCHPAILLQICKKYDIDCDNLEDYVVNRAKYLKEVMETYEVNRDSAKKLFIQLLYFGSFEGWAGNQGINKPATKNIKNFKKEIQAIGEVIKSNNDAIYQEIKKNKEKKEVKSFNEVGSVVSYYLQEIECRILEKIYQYCKQKCLIPADTNCVLCADGIMIQTEYFNEGLLNQFSKLIKDEFELDLKFTTKEMNEDYLAILDDHILTEDLIVARSLPDYNINIEIDMTKDFIITTLNNYFFADIEQLGEEKYIKYFQYTNSFKYFNAYHAHFYISNNIYKLFGSDVVAYENFKSTFDHLNFSLDKHKYKFTNLYLESKHKRCFSTFYFKPNDKEPTDKRNLFSNFKFDKGEYIYDQEVIKPFLNHIEYLCREDDKAEKPITNYVLNWFSHIIQKPEVKTKVALVIFSLTEGVGKNIVSDIFNEIVSGYGAKFRDTSALTDRFNAEMMGKLFVVGDEINARATEVANELKDIIARETENIELKGKDKLLLNDFKNYYFTTNNENVFKVSNTDRRFMFVEAPDDKKTEAGYYATLFNFKKDANCLTNLYNYFKTRDISTFEPVNIVKTEFKINLIMANLPAYIKFLIDRVEYVKGETLTPKELYDMSVSYAKDKRMVSTYTERLFTVQFKKVFTPYFKPDSETRRSQYTFPNTETLKEDLEKLIKEKYVM